MILFIMLYIKCVDETLVCEHSNKSYWAVLLHGTVCYAAEGGSAIAFMSVDETQCLTIQMKEISFISKYVRCFLNI